MSQEVLDIIRFKENLAGWREDAARILRDAGFDPDLLDEADKKASGKQPDSEEHRDLYGFHVFCFDSDLPNVHKLNDDTDPASAAYRMLRFTRIVQELIDERGVDVLAVIYAFELGSVFKHAELGMQFPKIAKAFQDRENKLVNERLNKKRHEETYKARDLVLSEWEQDINRFQSAAKAGNYYAVWLGARRYQFEPRTVTGWILEHAKKMDIKFR